MRSDPAVAENLDGVERSSDEKVRYRNGRTRGKSRSQESLVIGGVERAPGVADDHPGEVDPLVGEDALLFEAPGLRVGSAYGW